MRNRRAHNPRNLAALLLLAVALIAPAPATAQNKRHGSRPHPAGTATPINVHSIRGGADANGTVHVIVRLKTPGSGATAGSAAMGRIRTLDRQAMRTTIAQLGGTIDAQFSHIYNGLRVHMPMKRVETLAANPRVASISLVTRYQRPAFTSGAMRPANAGAAIAVHASSVWAQTASRFTGTGKGVAVAIVDTGIDYEHLDFGPGGANNFGEDAKVIGGTDLVGDNYDPGAGGSADLPFPDDDPKDCSTELGGGHGTHVAGTIAGFGVEYDSGTSSYSTYTGRYDASLTALDLASMHIAPGMAPRASLIAIRVFGCNGATEVAADGIEAAVAAGADIINVSLGSPYGIKGSAEQEAIDAATAAGVTVVVAAGNEGAGAFLVGSPSTEDGALSVAALDDRAKHPAVRLMRQDLASWVSVGTFLNTNVYDFGGDTYEHTIVSLFQDAGAGGNPSEYSLGCPSTGDDGSPYVQDWDTSRSDLSGTIVIIRRGECTFKEKVDAMLVKGVAGVIILQKQDLIVDDPEAYPPFLGAEYPTSNIPVLMANGDTETALVSALDGGLEGSPSRLELSPDGLANPYYQTVAEFSSGGPRWGDLALKPEVAAPGVDIVSAMSGSADGAAWMSGTSMATPVTAGVAALVKQAHPTWAPDAIKSAIIGSAESVGDGISLRSVGAGRINAQNAVAAAVTIKAGPNATLSFGWVKGDAQGTLIKTLSFVMTNRTMKTTKSTLRVGAAEGFDLPSGVTLAIYNGTKRLKSSTKISLAKGKSVTLTVTLTASVAAQNAFQGLTNEDEGDTADWALGGTLNALVHVDTPKKPSLRLPVFAVLRHTEAFTFEPTLTEFGPGISYTSTTGTASANTTVEAYTWIGHDSRERIANGADLRDLGFNAWVASDWSMFSHDMGALDLLLTSYTPSWNQALNEYDIEFDLNQDGSTDVSIVIGDYGYLFSGYADGTLGCLYVDYFGWVNNQLPGGTYDGGAEGICSASADPGSSALRVHLDDLYYFVNDDGNFGGIPEIPFTITSYNGGGWDYDQFGSMGNPFVINVESITEATGSIPSGSTPEWTNPGLEVIAESTTGEGGGFYMAYRGSQYYGNTDTGYIDSTCTPSLGWILRNPYGVDTASETYEVYLPLPN